MIARSVLPSRRPVRSCTPLRRGVTVVEVALLIIPFFLFLFGTFEYARYLLILHVATNAAREGARYATVKVSDPTITSTAITSSPFSSARPAYDVPVISARVEQKLAGLQSMIQGFNVRVFPCDPNTIYNDPPLFQPKSASSGWNDASFGNRIAVRITGNYVPALPNLLMMSSSVPVNLTVAMGSEG